MGDMVHRDISLPEKVENALASIASRQGVATNSVICEILTNAVESEAVPTNQSGPRSVPKRETCASK